MAIGQITGVFNDCVAILCVIDIVWWAKTGNHSLMATMVADRFGWDYSRAFTFCNRVVIASFLVMPVSIFCK